MKLTVYDSITEAFGSSANWLEIEGTDLKGIVYMSGTHKMSRYDEIHVGKFITDGSYLGLFKEVQRMFPRRKIVFSIEYSILKIYIIRLVGKTKINVLSSITVGLFYGRAKNYIINTALANIKKYHIAIHSELEKRFFSIIESKDLPHDPIGLYESLSGYTLSATEVKQITQRINLANNP